jgi:hypothetical protein
MRGDWELLPWVAGGKKAVTIFLCGNLIVHKTCSRVLLDDRYTVPSLSLPPPARPCLERHETARELGICPAGHQLVVGSLRRALDAGKCVFACVCMCVGLCTCGTTTPSPVRPQGGGQKQEQRQESRSKDAKSDEAKASSSEQV